MTVIETAKKFIVPAGLGLAMCTLVTACNCTKSKAQAQAAPPMEQPSTGMAEPSGAATEMQEAVIPLHQETLRVGKQDVQSGEVHLRKVIITEKTSQPVDLRRESLEIVREPAGANATTSSNLFEGQDIVIKLKEEQPVIEKQVTQSGSVVAKKSSQVEQRTISGEVRREDVQVDKSGAGANVTYKGGQINESAGAQPKQPESNTPQPQPQEKPNPDQPQPQPQEQQQ